MESVKLLETILKERRYLNKDLTIILAAGFEERSIAFLKKIKNFLLTVSKIIIIDYKNEDLNEPMKSKIFFESNNISKSFISIEAEKIYELKEHVNKNKLIIVDISGMTRVIMFNVLNLLDDIGLTYDIIYTEGETYFPVKSFYEKLIADNVDKEKAFSRYLEEERTDFVYSYDCEIFQPKDFIGNLEPGKSLMLLSFFTFKRSRLQILLQELEVERKVFILSEPIRDELKWRKEFMEIANLDLIQKNIPNVKTLNTLEPINVIDFFNEVTYKNKEYSRYNLILAPLGSKMQTIGSYFYWRQHPEISVIFSQPKTYSKDKYSESYRDTFVITYDVISQKFNKTTI